MEYVALKQMGLVLCLLQMCFKNIFSVAENYTPPHKLLMHFDVQ